MAMATGNCTRLTLQNAARLRIVDREANDLNTFCTLPPQIR
jgi:hypothetical protein